MPFHAITGVFGFVSSVISTYEVIHDTVRHCRSRFRPDRAEGELLRSLVRGMEDVEQEYENGYSWWGQRFARGDETAIEALYSIASRLRYVSATSGRGGRLDYRFLQAMSESSRRESITAMMDLCQRLSVSAPLRRALRHHPLEHHRPQAERIEIVEALPPHDYRPAVRTYARRGGRVVPFYEGYETGVARCSRCYPRDCLCDRGFYEDDDYLCDDYLRDDDHLRDDISLDDDRWSDDAYSRDDEYSNDGYMDGFYRADNFTSGPRPRMVFVDY